MTHDSEDPAADPVFEDESATVLELFGVKLNVSNKRIADILTMDAGEALSTDVRELLGPGEMRAARSDASQAAPDILITPPTGREQGDSQMRVSMRTRADAVGSALGFEVTAGGTWESPAGISIITRVVERPLSYAATADFVKKIATVLEDRDSEDATALFIVDSQQTADVFKVAIRQRRLQDHARTISTENLEMIRSLFGSDAIDHTQALVLLTPIANADVGEVLNIIRSAIAEEHRVDLDS